MTLSQIQAKVKRRVDDENIDADVLTDAINEIYLTILNDSRTQWKFLQGSANFNTVAGTAEYAKSSIASDIDRIYDIYHTNNALAALSRKELNRAQIGGAASGTPLCYDEWADVVRLDPVPSSVMNLTVDYFKAPARITDDNSTILIPDKDQDILVVGSAMLFYETDEDPARYDRAAQKYQDMLRKLIYKNETEPNRSPRMKMAKNYGAFQSWDYQR